MVDFQQVYFVDKRNNLDWKIVVEPEPRCCRIVDDEGSDNDDERNGMGNGIEVEVDLVPASPSPLDVHDPAGQVDAANATMEDTEDKQHLLDIDYPDVDFNEMADKIETASPLLQ